MSELSDIFRNHLGIGSSHRHPASPASPPSSNAHSHQPSTYYVGPIPYAHPSTTQGYYGPFPGFPAVPPPASMSYYPNQYLQDQALVSPAVANSPPVLEHASRPGAPILPPRPGTSLSPALSAAGALYYPGTYPTPELFPFPLSKHRVLSSPPHYTSVVIQEALDSLGPHSTLYLSPTTKWSISKTLWLHPHQEIATLGYPTTEHEVAWLDAEEGLTGHVLSGTGKPGVRIRNIGVDGGREKYGYCQECECIIQLGGREGNNQAIDHCFIRNPRQWSCLQVFQGCEGVRVTNNFIGPAGYDGEADPAGHWADGVSYAGFNGLIAGNQITDATDGGIVLFGAPGTVVTSNTIINRDRTGLGAINMVDFGPHDGDYTNTRVIHNTIHVDSGYLKIGIGQGCSVWLISPEKSSNRLRGATVKFNLITASRSGAVGYGFAVSEVDDWICTDNQASSSVIFSGDTSQMSMDPRHLNVGPGPFVRSPSRNGLGQANSDLQPEFSTGPIRHLIGIRPGKSSYRVVCPGQLNLRPGQSITLSETTLSFEWNGEVRLIKKQEIIWHSSTAGRAADPSKTTLEVDKQTGKLIIQEQGKLLADLTPHIPTIPDTALILSDSYPHLVMASTSSGSVVWAPLGYEVGYQWEARRDNCVCRTSADGQHTLVTTLNPYGQYVVLRTINGHDTGSHLPPSWPLDTNTWEVIWKSHDVDENKGMDPDSKIIFQGDGNLVIYSGATPGKPLWASGSCGLQPPVTRLQFGQGTDSSPLLSCVLDDGFVRWSTTGRSVGGGCL